MGNTNLVTIFLTGLFTGGLTCMAVQGGLLAATLAQREEDKLKEGLEQKDTALPIISFLVAKLIAYTLLGFLLGWLGSFFQLSIAAKVILQIAVAIFMLGTAFNILEVHPIFRYFVIQPPKFLTRFVRKQSKSKDMFAPAILGAFTIFIPCGTTQAMMALAIASGNAWFGAAVLFAFILGTSPLFFILGYFATKLGEKLHENFMIAAAFAIVLLAILNINTAIALTGQPYTLENMTRSFWCTVSWCKAANTPAGEPVKEATIAIRAVAYAPNVLTVKAGDTITLHLKNIDGQSCIQAFTIPQLGIQKVVPVGASDTVTFTAPSRPTDIAFMCTMGMFRGVIHVI